MNETARLEALAKMARREYQRQWRKRNPERVKEINARYWRRRAQKLQATEKGGSDAKTDV